MNYVASFDSRSTRTAWRVRGIESTRTSTLLAVALCLGLVGAAGGAAPGSNLLADAAGVTVSTLFAHSSPRQVEIQDRSLANSLFCWVDADRRVTCSTLDDPTGANAVVVASGIAEAGNYLFGVALTPVSQGSKVIWTDTGNGQPGFIYAKNADGTGTRLTVLDHGAGTSNLIWSIAYDEQTQNVIYSSSVPSQALYSVPLSGGASTVLRAVSTTVNAVVVDPTTRDLWYIISGQGMHRCHLDDCEGTDEMVISSACSSRSIALDYQARVVYWSCPPQIFRASMSDPQGTKEVLVDTGHLSNYAELDVHFNYQGTDETVLYSSDRTANVFYVIRGVEQGVPPGAVCLSAPVPAIANSNAETACPGTPHSGTCPMTCSNGYSSASAPVCNDGAWNTSSQVQCAPVSCGALPADAAGTWQLEAPNSGGTTGDSATLHCNDEHIAILGGPISGSATVSCVGTTEGAAQWQGSALGAVCRPAPQVSVEILHDTGGIFFGAAQDVALHRSGASTLNVLGALTVNGENVLTAGALLEDRDRDQEIDDLRATVGRLEKAVARLEAVLVDRDLPL